jgi:hypothetical protein
VALGKIRKIQLFKYSFAALFIVLFHKEQEYITFEQDICFFWKYMDFDVKIQSEYYIEYIFLSYVQLDLFKVNLMLKFIKPLYISVIGRNLCVYIIVLYFVIWK